MVADYCSTTQTVVADHRGSVTMQIPGGYWFLYQANRTVAADYRERSVTVQLITAISSNRAVIYRMHQK